MTRMDLLWPTDISAEALELSVAAAANQLGLMAKTRGELKSVRGSIHLHFAKPGESGTLEFTINPNDRTAWLSWHDNRKAPWVVETAEKLKQLLAS